MADAITLKINHKNNTIFTPKTNISHFSEQTSMKFSVLSTNVGIFKENACNGV
ncbi:MAG: hypothetical protein LBV22_03750 [Mycoplasmataceae bacterium]|jgi:hypothetical protein|nr:hypothetical protein [Mycoplasmataceae bacterium]